MNLCSETLRGRGPARSFLTDERGTSTVEFVLVVPLIVTLVLLVTDASLVFLRHSTLLNVSRDTARAVARHMLTEAQAKSYAEAASKTAASAPVATVTIADGAVTVLIEADAQTSAPFGVVRFLAGDVISATSINIMEPM